jgi:hypothetical protein
MSNVCHHLSWRASPQLVSPAEAVDRSEDQEKKDHVEGNCGSDQVGDWNCWEANWVDMNHFMGLSVCVGSLGERRRGCKRVATGFVFLD